MNLLEIITGAGTGGVLGGLLALGNSWLTAKARKDERAHELDTLRITQTRAESAAAWAALRSSHEAAAAEGSGHSWPWVEAIRTLTRPALTFGLIAAAIGTRGGPLGPDFLLLAGTAVGWWFGARPNLSNARK